MKYVQIQQERQQHGVNEILLMSLLTLNRFYAFSGISVVDFEQVNASWVKLYHNTLNSLVIGKYLF